MDKNKALTISGILLSIFLVGVFLRLAKSFLIPFVLAVFLYFIFSPALDILVRLRLSRGVAVTIVLLVTAMVLYMTGILFYESGKTLASELPKYGEKFGTMVDNLQQSLHLSGRKWDLSSWLKNLDINKVGSMVLSSLGTFFSFVSNIFLVLIFLIFMLSGRGKLSGKMKMMFSPQRSGQVLQLYEHVVSQIQKYLLLKTATSVASGILAASVLLIFGVDFAVAFGLLAFLLNYIPNIGAFIVKIPPFLIALIQFNSFWKAFWMLLIWAVLDSLIGMLVEPRIMGKGLGLSPLAILFFLFFWGWLWGVPGMILAVPIMAVVNIVCSNFPRLKFVTALLSK